MLGDLKGKSILITGASSGIGAAVARALGTLGARVGVHFNHGRERAEKLTAEIKKAGGDAAAFGADITKSPAVEKLIGDVVARFGRLDVLINNAGDLVSRTPLVDATDELYDKVMDLNARAVVTGSRAAIKQFRKQGGGGAIINTISVAARHGGRPGSLLYGASKAFVHNLTRGMAKEYAGDNIRVNAVAPGVILTPFHERHGTPQALETMAKGIPLGRLGTAEECVGAYLFLASNAMSGYVTGQTIDVNGGLHMP
jgi:3-oxoacyl-[acyl-carrier protein] reductase